MAIYRKTDWCLVTTVLARLRVLWFQLSTADTRTGPGTCVHLWENEKPGKGPHWGTGDNSVLLPMEFKHREY